MKNKIMLPTDKQVSVWFDKNIDPDCSVSTAIFKFRLWLMELENLSTEASWNDAINMAISIVNRYTLVDSNSSLMLMDELKKQFIFDGEFKKWYAEQFKEEGGVELWEEILSKLQFNSTSTSSKKMAERLSKEFTITRNKLL